MHGIREVAAPTAVQKGPNLVGVGSRILGNGRHGNLPRGIGAVIHGHGAEIPVSLIFRLERTHDLTPLIYFILPLGVVVCSLFPKGLASPFLLKYMVFY